MERPRGLRRTAKRTAEDAPEGDAAGASQSLSAAGTPGASKVRRTEAGNGSEDERGDAEVPGEVPATYSLDDAIDMLREGMLAAEADGGVELLEAAADTFEELIHSESTAASDRPAALRGAGLCWGEIGGHVSDVGVAVEYYEMAADRLKEAASGAGADTDAAFDAALAVLRLGEASAGEFAAVDAAIADAEAALARYTGNDHGEGAQMPSQLAAGRPTLATLVGSHALTFGSGERLRALGQTALRLCVSAVEEARTAGDGAVLLGMADVLVELAEHAAELECADIPTEWLSRDALGWLGEGLAFCADDDELRARLHAMSGEVYVLLAAFAEGGAAAADFNRRALASFRAANDAVAGHVPDESIADVEAELAS